MVYILWRILLWFRDHALEKSFRPATLTLQMEYTSLPVIDVNHSIPHEEFSRNYASRLRNLYPNEGKFQSSTCTRPKMASSPTKLAIWTITLKSSKSLRRRKNVLKTSTGDQPSAIFLLLLIPHFDVNFAIQTNRHPTKWNAFVTYISQRTSVWVR